MKNFYCIIISAALLFISFAAWTEGPVPNSIGEVVLLEGTAELSSFLTGERYTIDEHKKIVPGHKIRTGANTVLDVVLNDGNILNMKEETSLYFYYLKRKKTDPPTRLKMDFGKLQVSLEMKYNNKNLELATPCAVLSAVMADFSVIVSENETRVLVHKGRVGLESTNMSVTSAYVGTANEMISVFRDAPPSEPVIVKKNKNSWLDSFIVTDRYRKIKRKDEKKEILDWVKRKQDIR